MPFELCFLAHPDSYRPFAPKIFSFDQPTTLELDGHVQGLDEPDPAPENTVFPSQTLAYEQAFIGFDGSSFVLTPDDASSENVCVNNHLLQDRHVLKDGDTLDFGSYTRAGRSFTAECTIQVRICACAPKGTNWPGIRSLINYVRGTTMRSTASLQPNMAPPLSSRSACASSSLLDSVTRSSSPIDPPSQTTPVHYSAADYEAILRELRAFRMDIDRALPLPSDPPRDCSPDSRSHSASTPSVSTSVPTSVLPLSAFTPLPSTPYGDLVQSLRARPSKDAHKPLTTDVSSSLSAPSPTTRSVPAVSLSEPPPLSSASLAPSVESTPPLRSKADSVGGTGTASTDIAASTSVTITPLQSANMALQRVGAAWLSVRRDLHNSGAATAVIAVDRMRAAWSQARGTVEHAARSVASLSDTLGSSPSPSVGGDQLHGTINSSSSPLSLVHTPPSLIVPGLNSVGYLGSPFRYPAPILYQIHPSFTALSDPLLNLISTSPLPLSLPSAHTISHHAQLLPHLLGRFCFAPLPTPMH